MDRKGNYEIDRDRHSISVNYPVEMTNCQVEEATVKAAKEYLSLNKDSKITSLHVKTTPEFVCSDKKVCFMYVRDEVLFNILTGQSEEGVDLVKYVQKKLSKEKYLEIMRSTTSISEEEWMHSGSSKEKKYLSSILRVKVPGKDGHYVSMIPATPKKLNGISNKLICTYSGENLPKRYIKELLSQYMIDDSCSECLINQGTYRSKTAQGYAKHWITVQYKNCIHAAISHFFLKNILFKSNTYSFKYYQYDKFNAGSKAIK